MIYSIKNIVDFMNSKLIDLTPGAQLLGIARTATKDGVLMPFIKDRYVGFDDQVLFRLYHKENTLTSTEVPGTGYGDQRSNMVNTHSNSMLIYWNSQRLKLTTDQLYMALQKRLSGQLKADGIKRANIILTGAVLNDAQILAQEYGGAQVALRAENRITQVNYQITVVFDKNCLPACLQEC